MNPCAEFIMTCAELTAMTSGGYVPVKKLLPVLYERIGEEQVKQMLAAAIVANYHGRMQKSVHTWASTLIAESGRAKIYWPQLNISVLYDFAKEVLKSEKRKEEISRTVCAECRQTGNRNGKTY